MRGLKTDLYIVPNIFEITLVICVNNPSIVVRWVIFWVSFLFVFLEMQEIISLCAACHQKGILHIVRRVVLNHIGYSHCEGPISVILIASVIWKIFICRMYNDCFDWYQLFIIVFKIRGHAFLIRSWIWETVCSSFCYYSILENDKTYNRASFLVD